MLGKICVCFRTVYSPCKFSDKEIFPQITGALGNRGTLVDLYKITRASFGEMLEIKEASSFIRAMLERTADGKEIVEAVKLINDGVFSFRG